MWRNKEITAAAAACAAAAIAIMPVAALAQGEPTPGNDETVTYSGHILFRVRTASGGYTAAQRAYHIQQRLVPILSLPNLTPNDITVEQARPYQDASIYVRGRLLVTVDRTLAQANGNNDPGDLARAWANNLRGILPQVSVKPNPNVEAEGRAMNQAARAGSQNTNASSSAGSSTGSAANSSTP